MEETEEKKAVAHIEKFASDWLDGFRKSLAHSSELPAMMVVISSTHEDFFMNILKKAYPGKTVLPISMADLSDTVVYERGVIRETVSGIHAVALRTIVL